MGINISILPLGAHGLNGLKGERKPTKAWVRAGRPYSSLLPAYLDDSTSDVDIYGEGIIIASTPIPLQNC